jgi:hypothetical protein
MAFLSFYRLYASLCVGGLFYIFCFHSLGAALLSALLTRGIWFFVEYFVKRMVTNALYQQHIYDFKQQLGPYGIRVANQAEENRRVKESLSEVFIDSPEKLQKTAETLQLIDTLYQAGMTPDQDSRLLHDCKIKYAKYRLEKRRNQADD